MRVRADPAGIQALTERRPGAESAGHESTQDHVYMVLEYCVGGDLAQAMASRRQEPVEEPLARGLVRQLAAGTQA